MGTHPIFESDFDCLTDQRMAANRERTFIAIKPDGVQRGLVGKIVKRFEQRGFKLVALKMCAPGRAHMEKRQKKKRKEKWWRSRTSSSTLSRGTTRRTWASWKSSSA